MSSYPAAYFATYQPNTAFDMIASLPGFTLELGASVRGFGGAAGNVLVDGVRPTAKDDSLDEILRRIPAASVLRIEMIRGGAPGVDMQGKTVLANLILRKDRGLKLAIAASGTRWYDGRLGRGLRIEASKSFGDTHVEGSLLLDRGIDDLAGNGARVLRDASGAVSQVYNEHNAGDTAAYKFTGAIETPVWGGKARLNLSLSSYPFRLLQDDTPPGGGSGSIADLYHQSQRTAEIGLRYDRPLGGRASLETIVLQQLGQYRQTDDYSAPGDIQQFELFKRTDESIVRTTLKIDAARSLSFRVGVEGDYNWLKDDTDYIVNSTPVTVPAADVRVSETRGEGFVSGTWQAAKTLTLEAGLRVEASKIAASGDVVSRRTFVYPKPRVVFTWSPNGTNQIRMRVEREVGQLNFDDFAAGQAALINGQIHAGNPDLTPQQDWVFESAFEHKLWTSADITVTLRHYALTDVIDREPIFAASGTYDAPGNIGSGRKSEVAVSFTLPTDKLLIPRGLITGAATWRWSSVTDPTTGQRREISGLHPADAEIHFSQGLARLKTTWGVDVYDQWRETYYRYNEIDTDKKKIYVSMFIDYKPRADLSVRFELENLTGRGIEHAREIFAGQRVFQSPQPGSLDPPSSTDTRSLHNGRGLYLRIRKTFN